MLEQRRRVMLFGGIDIQSEWQGGLVQTMSKPVSTSTAAYFKGPSLPVRVQNCTAGLGETATKAVSRVPIIVINFTLQKPTQPTLA